MSANRVNWYCQVIRGNYVSRKVNPQNLETRKKWGCVSLTLYLGNLIFLTKNLLPGRLHCRLLQNHWFYNKKLFNMTRQRFNKNHLFDIRNCVKHSPKYTARGAVPKANRNSGETEKLKKMETQHTLVFI